jgi:hypothetical protein
MPFFDVAEKLSEEQKVTIKQKYFYYLFGRLKNLLTIAVF